MHPFMKAMAEKLSNQIISTIKLETTPVMQAATAKLVVSHIAQDPASCAQMVEMTGAVLRKAVDALPSKLSSEFTGDLLSPDNQLGRTVCLTGIFNKAMEFYTAVQEQRHPFSQFVAENPLPVSAEQLNLDSLNHSAVILMRLESQRLPDERLAVGGYCEMYLVDRELLPDGTNRILDTDPKVSEIGSLH